MFFFFISAFVQQQISAVTATSARNIGRKQSTKCAVDTLHKYTK